MLLMNVTLTTLNLYGKVAALLGMTFKRAKNVETRDCVVQITGLGQKEQEH